MQVLYTTYVTLPLLQKCRTPAKPHARAPTRAHTHSHGRTRANTHAHALVYGVYMVKTTDRLLHSGLSTYQDSATLVVPFTNFAICADTRSSSFWSQAVITHAHIYAHVYYTHVCLQCLKYRGMASIVQA